MAAIQITKITGSPVNVLNFGADPTGRRDSTKAFQAAMNEAWTNGKPLYIPSGKYIAKIMIPQVPPGFDYRAHVFNIYGDGAPNGFLGSSTISGTTVVSPDTDPVLQYNNFFPENQVGSAHIYLSKIRFEANNPNSVLRFQTFSDYSKISQCEVRQYGSGNGITFDHAYAGEISECHIMADLGSRLPGARTGTGISVSLSSGASGGILTLRKVTSRAFNVGFAIGGSASPSILATRMEQCECSTLNYGILLGTGVRKTVIDNCYFEGVEYTCIYDRGNSTTISNCFMVGTATQCFAKGIESTDATFGNQYIGNEILLNESNSIGIDLYTAGDAVGQQKVVRNNLIYFMNDGQSIANVVGIRLTGANPLAIVADNTFRPRRKWTGGAGTIKVDDRTTGVNTGVVPLTDTLHEFPLYSNIGLSLAYGGFLNQANIVSGVLDIGAGSQFDVACSVPATVTSIQFNSKSERLVLFKSANSNTTFKKGPRLQMVSDFTGIGTILFCLRVIGGVPVAYEITRTRYDQVDDQTQSVGGTVTVRNRNSKGNVTFPTPQPDANYRVTVSPLESTGTPAVGSNRLLANVVRTTTGFTFSLEAAPGDNNSVTFAWQIFRS